MIRKTITTLSVVALAAATTALPVAAASDSGAVGVQIAACNPCSAKKACNPCAAKACNPCAAKRACNPCAAKKACNPCAAKR
jgi:hypothetical protein